MKQEQVAEVFAFAENNFREKLQLDNCPHSGTYHGEDRRCRGCEQSIECEWLSTNSPTPIALEQSVNQLVDSLELAIVSIHSAVANHQSSRWSCQCPSCNWLDQAEKVYDQLRS